MKKNYCYPQYSRTIQAESREAADIILEEILKKENEAQNVAAPTDTVSDMDTHRLEIDPENVEDTAIPDESTEPETETEAPEPEKKQVKKVKNKGIPDNVSNK
jgi:hypothetical protein